MKNGKQILSRACAGLVFGLAVRLFFSSGGGYSGMSENVASAESLTKSNSNSQVIQAEIREAPQLPSAAARSAIESGAIKFIIRSKSNSDDAEVARILMDLGSIALCRNGETMSVWRNGRWDPIQNLDQLSGYAVGRAWELSSRTALGNAAEQLPASAATYLVMPVIQELRLVGAVEKALPAPLTEHTRVELMVERTSGGHVRWTLERAVRRDGAVVTPHAALPG